MESNRALPAECCKRRRISRARPFQNLLRMFPPSSFAARFLLAARENIPPEKKRQNQSNNTWSFCCFFFLSCTNTTRCARERIDSYTVFGNNPCPNDPIRYFFFPARCWLIASAFLLFHRKNLIENKKSNPRQEENVQQVLPKLVARWDVSAENVSRPGIRFGYALQPEQDDASVRRGHSVSRNGIDGRTSAGMRERPSSWTYFSLFFWGFK